MDMFDIAIVGGGLIGPSMALVLQGAGFEVVLVDRHPVESRQAPDFDGRAYAVSLASQRLMDQIGIWSGIDPQAEPILDIHVSQGGAPDPQLHFDPRELDEGRFGWIVEDRWLRRALLDRIAERGIPHRAPSEVVTAEMNGPAARITLSDGSEIKASLIIAADGRKSRLARQAGIRRIGWSYAQSGLVNAIEHERAHHGIAHQSFFPGGPFAVLPLPGNRSSLVWSERRGEADRLSRLSDPEFTEEIAHRIGGRLGKISLAGRRWSYPLDLTLADRFVADRLALVGDAAHGVHPIAGQGMNLGLRDVAALAEVLTDASRLGEDIGTLPVLERYQRWRRFDTTVMALGMDGLNRLFSNDIQPLNLLRSAGLRLVDNWDGLRRGFMRQAIGAEGDIPRLLRGLPL